MRQPIRIPVDRREAAATEESAEWTAASPSVWERARGGLVALVQRANRAERHSNRLGTTTGPVGRKLESHGCDPLGEAVARRRDGSALLGPCRAGGCDVEPTARGGDAAIGLDEERAIVAHEEAALVVGDPLALAVTAATALE